MVTVISPNLGEPVTKMDLATANSSPDCAGTDIWVNTHIVVTTPIVAATDRQIHFGKGGYVTFTGSGALTGLAEARPEWFGSSNTGLAFLNAVNSLVIGGTLKLSAASYISPYTNPFTTYLNRGVKISGEKLPDFSSDHTALQNGTIIQGPFYVRSHDVEISNLGFDSGSAVIAAQYAGVGQDAFAIIGDPTHAPGAPPWGGFRANNIRALGSSPTALFHAFLCENVFGAEVHYIETMFNEHGIVFKAIASNISNLRAFGHAADGVIFKDDAYAQCHNNNATNIYIQSVNPYDGAGLIVQSATGPGITNIDITNALVVGTTFGYRIGYGGPPGTATRDITLTNATARATSGNGFELSHGGGVISAVTLTNTLATANSGIGYWIANSDIDRTLFMGTRAEGNGGDAYRLDGVGTRLVSPFAQGNGLTGMYGYNLVGSVLADSLYAYGYSSTAQFTGGSGVWTTPDENVTVPALTSPWANIPSNNSPVGYWRGGGYVNLRGLIGGGSAGDVLFTLPPSHEPAYNMRFPVLTYNTSTLDTKIGELAIDIHGEVVLVSGYTGYVSLDGVRFRSGP